MVEHIEVLEQTETVMGIAKNDMKDGDPKHAIQILDVAQKAQRAARRQIMIHVKKKMGSVPMRSDAPPFGTRPMVDPAEKY